MKPLVTSAMIQSVPIDDKLGPPSEQLAGALNAALEPLLAEWKAAIVEGCAQLLEREANMYGNTGKNAGGKFLRDAAKSVRTLAPADALARHDSAVRLEAIRECLKVAWKHRDERQPYDKSYGQEELNASATTASAISDEIAALEVKP